MANAALRDEVFAANRAVGRIALAIAGGTGGSRRTRVHESGSLRVRFPNGTGQALDAVIVNTAGGMTGGDRFDVDIKVGAGAKLSMTTAAAEKIYRSLGPDSEIGVRLDVGPGGALAWLPQETILFDRARLRRRIDVDLARDASLLLAEAGVFGRSGMGETVASGCFSDRWRVRIDGSLVFVELVQLNGGIAQRLAERAIAGGGAAVASVMKISRRRAKCCDGSVHAARYCRRSRCILLERACAGLLCRARRRRVASRSCKGADRALGSGPLPRLWLN